jgi:hypothetical protein
MKKKKLQWFGHAKRMDRTRIQRKTQELKSTGKKAYGKSQNKMV